MHGSSGLTRNFQPKPAYYAMAQLQRVLGNYRFDKILVNEPGKLRIQQYVTPDSEETIWAVWMPVGDSDGKALTLELTEKPYAIEEISHTKEASKADLKVKEEGATSMSVSSSPIYLKFRKQPSRLPIYK